MPKAATAPKALAIWSVFIEWMIADHDADGQAA